MKLSTRLPTVFLLFFVAVVSLGNSECAESVPQGSTDLPQTADAGEDGIDSCEGCACPRIFVPVCGEDGNTWPNACEAQCADVEIASVGPCPRFECGGPEGGACEEGEFCDTRPGCDASARGFCEEIPGACTDEDSPVCGCDGVTYPNDCARRAAAVTLDFRGECDDGPERCDSIEDCGDGEYCGRREEVCDSEPGTCLERPVLCSLKFDPVCGCDGETYSNACAAAGAGANVAYDGECDPGPVACRDNLDCSDDDYCQKPEGRCDSMGVCERRPDICPLVIDTVCGCNGESYDNECVAATAGASVDHDGKCDSDGKVAVCHIPPGNPSARHTIYVGEPAVPAHLGHGDYLGECRE